MNRISMLFLVLVLILSACGASGEVEAHQIWVRPTAQGENAAVYLTIHNHSATADELIGASSPVADVVEIHESKMENDVVQMSMISSIPLGPDEEAILTPGGYHIMLIDINQELVLGEHIGLILHFKNHEDITVEVHIEDSIPNEEHESDEDH
ncbi:MAG TPA: copper chaperone PCu(A)C [Anaerolineales bacterium]|nr:copper chaperone PCu(A)C [Anaerolineales bacterium]